MMQRTQLRRAENSLDKHTDGFYMWGLESPLKVLFHHHQGEMYNENGINYC